MEIIILGLCPKPRRSALAILQTCPHALRYRLQAITILGLCPKRIKKVSCTGHLFY